VPIGGHHRSDRSVSAEWLTPPDLIEALGPFELDPCVPPGMPWPTARAMFVRGEINGLQAPWWGRVWLNPPYGAATAAWLKRLAIHGDGFALTFARTETDAWRRHVWPRASAILFLAGRLNFYRVDGTRSRRNAGGPSAIIAYGDECAARLQRPASGLGLAGGLVVAPRFCAGLLATALAGKVHRASAAGAP